MRKRVRVLLAALSLCAAVTALAADEVKLYVKARNTRLMASAAPTADVVAVLQPGDEVAWLGADANNKQWHHVQLKGKRGKKGLVFQSNLSAKPPNMELTKKGGRPIDAQAFANSGAAVKGLSEGAIKYGNGKKDPDLSQAVQQVQAIETLAKDITDTALAEHVDKAHLFPVVGPSKTISRGRK